MESKDWKRVQTVRLTGDGQVYMLPCFLFSVCFKGSQNNSCSAALRDGDNSNGAVLVTVIGNDRTPCIYRYDPPMFFQNGIYISGDKLEEVTVQFMPE